MVNHITLYNQLISLCIMGPAAIVAIPFMTVWTGVAARDIVSAANGHTVRYDLSSVDRSDKVV